MPARKIEIDDLFRLRTITGAHLSPDGTTIAFAVLRQDLAKNKAFSSLYAVPAGGGRLRRLTRGDHADSMPRFSPDGRRLGFLSNRDKVRSLWVLPMDGGEAARITDAGESVSDFDWSPDGSRVVYAARRLTEREALERDGKTGELAKLPHFRHVTRLLYRTDGVGFRTGEDTHILLRKVTGGKAVRLTEGAAADHGEPRFSPDGARVSFVSNRLPDPDLFFENSDIYTVGLDGKGLRKVTREPGLVCSHAWAPDGSAIYYLGYVGGPREWNLHHVHVRRVAAGGGPSTDLMPDLDAQALNSVIGDTAAAGACAPVPAADGSRVFFAATREGACHLGSVPAEGGPIEWSIVGDVSVLDFGGSTAAGPAWAVLADFLSPSELHRLSPGSAPKRVTKLNHGALAGWELSEPEEVRYPRKGGSVHGWVLRPPRARKGAKYPVVLEVHGGPHVCYGHVFFHEMQLLAAQGYVVLMTNPRGSDGYGRDHRMAIQGAYGTVDAEDLATALDGLVSGGGVDEGRVFLTGGSYGGYMTNWLVSHTGRFRAAVTQRSVTDFRSFFGSSDIGYEFPASEIGGMPWENPEEYARCSPITHAANIRTPLLILHSESDLRCPIEQAEQLFATLKILGREVEMVRFVGESHGLSRGGRPQNRAERLRRILGWFRSHGGR